MNKRGQGLSMTMIIVIILAVLVLLVVALIFLGGTTGLAGRLRAIFLPQQAIAADLAIQNCEQWCSIAETANDPSKSAYCNSLQEGVDYDRDGNPDKVGDKNKVWFCTEQAWNNWAANNPAKAADVDGRTGFLDVPCSVSCRP